MLNLSPFLSIPYKHKGRDYSGADCYGFILLFYRDVLHKKLYDIEEDYAPDWTFKNKNYFIENYYRHFQKVDVPKLYDMILFQGKQGIANHGGVVLGYGKFIHCCKEGVLVDTYTRSGWEKKINGFYRFKGR
jgi:cell wall-associated NlpC family hydrolase